MKDKNEEKVIPLTPETSPVSEDTAENGDAAEKAQETAQEAAQGASDTEAVPEEAIPLEIVVDDGVERVPIKNTLGDEIGCFTFRPTDIFNIIARFNEMADTFDTITAPLEKISLKPDGTAGSAVDLSPLKEAEKRLYEMLDYVLGGNAATAFFGTVNPFTPIHGAFYCETVLNVVGEYISRRFSVEAHKISARTSRHLNPNRQQRRMNKKK